MTPLRIAVADDDADMRAFFEKFLPRLGHQVITSAEDGAQLVEQCQDAQPDLLIADYKMPNMDGLQAIAAVRQARPLPAILVTGYHDPETIARATQMNVEGFLVKPITEADLGPAIAVVMERHRQVDALRQETETLRQHLEERKLIERAKGIVSKRLQLDEGEAFTRLRRLASDRNWKMVDLSREVIKAEELFQLMEVGQRAPARRGR